MKKLIRAVYKKVYLPNSYKNYTIDEILDFAFNNVKYYKQFKGCKLSELPILTKDIIRNNYNELLCDNINNRKTYINTSGGTTGEPVRLIQDNEYRQNFRLTAYNQKQEVGYNFAEPLIKIWGSERDILKGSIGYRAKFFNYLKNCHFLNSFYLTEKIIKNHIKIINQIRPKLIIGYVHSMYEISQYINKNNISVEPVHLVMCTAGTLYTFMETEISKAFNSKVINRYGSREVGNIACSTLRHKDLKIAQNHVFIEIVDEFDNPCPEDIEGNIVVTLLSNYSMPLIRYKIEDRGILNSSRFDYLVLTKISGRDNEFLRTSSGKLIDGEFITHIFYFKNWVQKFQVIQNDYESLDINILCNYPPSLNRVSTLEQELKRLMEFSCTINFNFVDEIKSKNSGKFSYIICNIV